MANRKRRWMWRELQECPAGEPRPRRPTNYRRPDFMTNKHGQTVRFHVPHPTKPALDRFFAHTELVSVDGEYCIVWTGGDTFRVDDDTVTTPARFYWEEAMGKEKLGKNDKLRRDCYTPRCVKHKKRQTQ